MTRSADKPADVLSAHDERATPSRRTMLKAGAAIVGMSVVGRAGMVAAQDATPGATPLPCVLTAEMTEGPFWLDDMLVRKDVTEGTPGLPLRLRIGVADVQACGPLANAAVDIWHCDAQGYYSGISGENPGGGSASSTDEDLDTTFLRGIQLTDETGFVEFDTIYPGWYQGRTIHIHMKVTVDGQADETYESGHVAHIGQLFFDDAVSDEVFTTEAYAGRPNDQRLRNDQDNILGDHADEPGVMLELTRLDDGSIEAGFLGTIVVGVDTAAM